MGLPHFLTNEKNVINAKNIFELIFAKNVIGRRGITLGKEIYHGSKLLVEYPEIHVARYNKDFYWGFYCTELKTQAEKWAVRHGTPGIVSVFEYSPDPELKVLQFPQMNEEWLDLIVACRSGKSHFYDIVEGPMADDTIFNYLQDFIDQKISREAFWALAKFKHPTQQISFHTARALNTIEFKRSYEVK